MSEIKEQSFDTGYIKEIITTEKYLITNVNFSISERTKEVQLTITLETAKIEKIVTWKLTPAQIKEIIDYTSDGGAPFNIISFIHSIDIKKMLDEA